MPEFNNHPLDEPGISNRFIEPCILVIFGATGDLTARKLLPAIYNLAREGQLPAQFACVGFARRDKTNEQFRQEMRTALDQFARTKPVDENLWQAFSKKIFYHRSPFDDDQGYDSLNKKLQELDQTFHTEGNRLFYLATPPSYFPLIVEKIQ